MTVYQQGLRAVTTITIAIIQNGAFIVGLDWPHTVSIHDLSPMFTQILILIYLPGMRFCYAPDFETGFLEPMPKSSTKQTLTKQTVMGRC